MLGKLIKTAVNIPLKTSKAALGGTSKVLNSGEDLLEDLMDDLEELLEDIFDD